MKKIKHRNKYEMHGTYEEVQEVDTYMAMLRMKNDALKEQADIETGFSNCKIKIRV